MEETPRRRITVMSSLNGISTDQLGNRVGGVTPPPPPLLQQSSGQIFKDDVKVFLPPQMFASWTAVIIVNEVFFQCKVDMRSSKDKRFKVSGSYPAFFLPIATTSNKKFFESEVTVNEKCRC